MMVTYELYDRKNEYDFPGFKPTTYLCGRNPKQRVKAGKLNDQFIQGIHWNNVIESLRNGDLLALYSWMDQQYDDEEDTNEEWHPMALFTQANSQDNPTWNEAMNGPDAEGYWSAAQIEYNTLVQKEAWDIVERQEWMNVLPGTWAFKCKRFPDGLIKKLKARFCVRGDKQKEDIDFIKEGTYAPVVNWSAVRLLLILSILLNLSTKQFDYTAAFVQAPIKENVFVEPPRGFPQRGKVLKFKRSLYGLKQSPRNFFTGDTRL